MPRILQLTDSHLMQRAPEIPPREFSDAVHLLTGRSSTEATQAVCDAALALSQAVDLVIHTGDLVDELTADAYAAAKAQLDQFGVPVLATPGNHDDPDLLAATFGDRVAITAAAHDIGAWRVVITSSFDPGAHSGTFSDATLTALTDQIDCDRHVLIGTHHPPLSPCTDHECINIRGAEFLLAVDERPNVKAVVAGHLHLEDDITRRGVHHFVTPSSALQLRHVHPLPDNNSEPTQAGARILDLHDDGTITTEVLWA